MPDTASQRFLHTTRKFVHTPPFVKSWAALGLNDQHLQALEGIILENPDVGDTIEGTGGAKKIRFQLGNKGKRGGARVIYVDIYGAESVYFLFAYAKNVQEDLTPEQKRIIHMMITSIKKERLQWQNYILNPP